MVSEPRHSAVRAQRPSAPCARAGVTLVELLIAVGLVAVLFTAVLQLLDRTLGVWTKTEQRRELVDGGASVLALLTRDLGLIESGPRGDLLAEWVAFDVDGDGARETVLPHLRLVRRASPAEFARLAVRDLERDAAHAAEEGSTASAATRSRTVPSNVGLLEVVWALRPAYSGPMPATDPGRGAECVLLRAERIVDGNPATASFFELDFAARDAGAALDEVIGGVLWLGLGFASELTSLPSSIETRTEVNGGAGGVLASWRIGDQLGDAGTAWDAWRRNHLDPTITPLNAVPRGAGEPGARPVLPRRVRIELELEREADRKRRPRLAAAVEPRDVVIVVSDGTRLPRMTGDAPSGRATGGTAGGARFIKVGAEWMQLVAVEGDRATVLRGMRGTSALGHAGGSLVHHGLPLVQEVGLGTRGDWHP